MPSRIATMRQRQISLIQGLAQLWRGSASPACGPAAAAGLAALHTPQAPIGSLSNIGTARQALQLVSCRWFTPMPLRQAPERDYVALNSIADNPGATHYVSSAMVARQRQHCWRREQRQLLPC